MNIRHRKHLLDIPRSKVPLRRVHYQVNKTLTIRSRHHLHISKPLQIPTHNNHHHRQVLGTRPNNPLMHHPHLLEHLRAQRQHKDIFHTGHRAKRLVRLQSVEVGTKASTDRIGLG